ncbi:hypothetical protein [Mesorhizobium sp. M7A.F.Ca.MR.176.00.0.0]|uniref:hypothetical protein n=1 Tax=Mesorhizobium sp. M7A.F.Ca.MR.176.00.0.0 TaxID=2496776 RepID=UPI000FE2F6F1|nr:hypothetical protein [Mesorhizobium sp. M7A.F.Ca.MR.176.00.0.0]
MIDPLESLIHHLEGALSAAHAMKAESLQKDTAPEHSMENMPDDLIDLAVVAQEFDMEKDTLRKLCREKRIGIKPAGTRWLVSVSKLRLLRQGK